MSRYLNTTGLQQDHRRSLITAGVFIAGLIAAYLVAQFVLDNDFKGLGLLPVAVEVNLNSPLR